MAVYIGSKKISSKSDVSKLSSHEKKIYNRLPQSSRDRVESSKSSSSSSSKSSSSSSSSSSSKTLTPAESIEAKKAASPTGTVKFSDLTEVEKAYLRRNDTYYKTFAYEDGNKKYLPRPCSDSDFMIELPDRIWKRKHEIITKIYGFSEDSFEARTTPKQEAFWRFSPAC